MIVKGPFDIAYGADELSEVEAVDVSYDVATDSFESLQGFTHEVAGAHKIQLGVTLLETDVPALAVLLPQYYKANGALLSTGEVVNNVDGAIDLVPGGCDVASSPTDLVITSCGNPGHVTRIPDAVTEFDGFEIGKIRKVKVKIKGESTAATVQFFKEGAVNIVS
jgi:hypothetical protein